MSNMTEYITVKNVKNEQWTVKQLLSKLDKEKLKKPKSQRKKKWTIHPKNDKTPNIFAYIKFLYDNRNSVQSITFGEVRNSYGINYSNIDGNNRINAIKYFMDKPFEVFTHYLDNLFEIFDNINNNTEDNTEDMNKNIYEIKKIFKSLSYKDFIEIKTPAKFFRDISRNDLWFKIMENRNNENDTEQKIEEEIEIIQKKLKINEDESFDSNVKINITIFEGYTIEELSKMQEDINKYDNTLTYTEILACRLFNIIDFTINDKHLETDLKKSIEQYYKDISNDEVLDCYVFDKDKEQINAFDFLVGFQIDYSEKYNFINKDDVQGMLLFFKLWKSLYNSFDYTFTTENINDFIEKIKYCCNIIKYTISKIFSDNINEKLFNKSCQYKLNTLKKNNIFMLFCSIIGFKNKNIEEKEIIRNLEKSLLYHFIINDIKDKNKKEEFKYYDSITYKMGGVAIDNHCKNLLSNPEKIINKELHNKFIELLNYLLEEIHIPHKRELDIHNKTELDTGTNKRKYKRDKRRKLRFVDKTLMFYFFKNKMPINMLSEEYSIEHIAPNSSNWNGKLDKDRTGNLIPIISSINIKRGNKHINTYDKTEEGLNFRKYMEEIIPDDTTYDEIIRYDNKKPFIKNNEKYNKMCKKNEEIYKNNLIECLFE